MLVGVSGFESRRKMGARDRRVDLRALARRVPRFDAGEAVRDMSAICGIRSQRETMG
jgi:hypothetical protein